MTKLYLSITVKREREKERKIKKLLLPDRVAFSNINQLDISRHSAMWIKRLFEIYFHVYFVIVV